MKIFQLQIRIHGRKLDILKTVLCALAQKRKLFIV